MVRTNTLFLKLFTLYYVSVQKTGKNRLPTNMTDSHSAKTIKIRVIIKHFPTIHVGLTSPQGPDSLGLLLASTRTLVHLTRTRTH